MQPPNMTSSLITTLALPFGRTLPPPSNDQPEVQFDPLNMEQQNAYRERKTRWGQRLMKRSKIQEDVVFNPIEMLYHGKSLQPITQYGQQDNDIKMELYGHGKQRKSKWHHQIQKTFTPPMLNYISPYVSLDEIQYLLRLFRLDQLTWTMTEFVPEDNQIRSPSPQPIYDKDGIKINTREARKKNQYLREKNSLIQDCMRIRKTFVPPSDYKPLKKFKKIYLSNTAMNDSKANYIGRLIGPKGTTQKLIQKRSGCKIAVRGKGANKAQKDIFEKHEALHVLIVADTDQQLDKGVQQVENIFNNEEDEELKELLESYNMQLQGVFNDNYCQNCEQEGHKTWACPFANTKTQVNIKCSICGEKSHPTSDCPERQAYLKKQQSDQITRLLESQYEQFQQEIGGMVGSRGMETEQQQQQPPKPQVANFFITDTNIKQLLAINAEKAQMQPPMPMRDSKTGNNTKPPPSMLGLGGSTGSSFGSSIPMGSMPLGSTPLAVTTVPASLFASSTPAVPAVIPSRSGATPLGPLAPPVLPPGSRAGGLQLTNPIVPGKEKKPEDAQKLPKFLDQ